MEDCEVAPNILNINLQKLGLKKVGNKNAFDTRYEELDKIYKAIQSLKECDFDIIDKKLKLFYTTV